jgi:ATP-dependent DNA ligase
MFAELDVWAFDLLHHNGRDLREFRERQGDLRRRLALILFGSRPRSTENGVDSRTSIAWCRCIGPE